MATMAGSAGSADAEMEVIMDSLDYKLNQLSQTWVGIAQGFFDTDMLKAAVDALNALSGVVESVINNMGNLGAILGTVGAAIVTFSGHNILGGLGTALISSISSMSGFSGAAKGASLSIEQYDEELTESNVITGVFSNTTKQATGNVTKLSSSMAGLSSAVKGAATALGTFALNAVVLTALGKIITGISDAYQNFKNRVEDARTALENSVSDYNSARDSLESLEEQLDSVQKQMAELSEQKGITNLVDDDEYQQLVKTNDELERQIELQKQQTKIAGRDTWNQARNTYTELTTQSGTFWQNYDRSYNAEATERSRQTAANSPNTVSNRLIETEKDNINYLLGTYEGLEEVYERLNDNIQETYTNEAKAIDERNKIVDTATDEELKILDDRIEEYQKEREELKSQSTEISDYISTLSGYLATYYNTVTDVTETYEHALEDGVTMSVIDTEMYESAFATQKAIESGYYGIEDSIEEVEEEVEKASVVFRNMGKVELNTASLTDAISKCNSLNDNFTKLSKIYESLEDTSEAFDFTLLDDSTIEAFSVYGDAFDDLVQQIKEAPDDVEAWQNTINNLVTAMLDASGITEILNDNTVDLVGQMLEEAGVINGTEYAYELLAQQKVLAEYATWDMTTACADEINAFLDEENVLDDIKNAVVGYYLSKIDANDIVLGTQGDCDNIAALISYCGAGVDAIQALYEARDGYQTSMNRLSELTEEYQEAVSDNNISRMRYLQYEMNKTTNEMQDYTEQANAVIQDAMNSIEGWTFTTTNATLGTPRTANYNPSSGSGSSSSSSGSSSSAATESEPTSTIFDWIDYKIDATEKRIDELQDKVSDATGFTLKNATTDTAIDEMNDLLATYQSMYDMYMEQAYSYNLPESYIDKIINGAMEIEEIIEDADIAEEESIVNQINNFKEWYDKAQDVDDKMKDLKAQIKELNKSKLDNIINDFDNLSDLMSTYTDYRDSLISLREASGETIYQSDYEALIADQNAIYATLATQYNKVRDQYDKLLASGDIEKYTDEWYEYEKELVSIQSAMADCKQEVLELEEQILELRFEPLEEFADYIDYLTDGISTLSSLIGDSNLVVDGMLTDRGLAQVALYEKGLSSAKQTVAEYGEAIDALNQMYEQGDITLEQYNERLYEYQSAQNSAILSVQDYRESILDLCKTAIEQEIDDMETLIQERKDALSAEKELTNYQKKVADAEKNIATLQAKIAALSGSQSREDQALRLQLEAELAEAEEELAEMTADHEQETIEDALDAELDAYTKEKNEELDMLEWNLDAQDAAIEKYLQEVTDNYEIVYATLEEYGEYYSMSMIDVLTEPWDSATSATNTFVDAVSDAVSTINYELNQIDTSSLSELIDLLNNYSNSTAMTYAESATSGSRATNYLDITGQGSWYQGQGGKWWYGEPYQSNGDYWYAENGTYTINGKQYGFNDEGYMITGWDDSAGEWRYFEPENGQLVKSSWRKSGGEWYYLDSNGWMARNAAVAAKDGSGYYLIDSDGVCENYDNPIPFNRVDFDRYKNTYAKGTTNAEAGAALVNEEGYELMRTNEGDLITLKGGEDIFTARETARLHDLAQLPVDDVTPFDRYAAEHLGGDNSTLNINAPLFEVTGGLDVEMRDYIDERIDEVPEIIARYRKIR